MLVSEAAGERPTISLTNDQIRVLREIVPSQIGALLNRNGNRCSAQDVWQIIDWVHRMPGTSPAMPSGGLPLPDTLRAPVLEHRASRFDLLASSASTEPAPPSSEPVPPSALTQLFYPPAYVELLREDAATLGFEPDPDGKLPTRQVTMEEAAALRKLGVPIDKFIKDHGFELDAGQLLALSDFIEIHLQRPDPPKAAPAELDAMTKKLMNLAAGLQDRNQDTVALKDYDIEVLKKYGVPIARMLEENQNEWDEFALTRLADAVQSLKWLNASDFSPANTRVALLKTQATAFDSLAKLLQEGGTSPLSSTTIDRLRELNVDIDRFVAKCGQDLNAQQYASLAALTRKAIQSPYIPPAAGPSASADIELLLMDAAAVPAMPAIPGSSATETPTGIASKPPVTPKPYV
jgi:hypothetical protein